MQNYLGHCERQRSRSVSDRTQQSQDLAIASFHSVPLAMTNIQLILPKYLPSAKTYGVKRINDFV